MKFFLHKKLGMFLLAMVTAGGFLVSQEQNAPSPGETPAVNQVKNETDPASYIGYTLEMVFKQLGAPKSVHPVRGTEAWQDDVVFVYSSVEIYLFRDRVWQVCPVSVYNMKMGDSSGAVAQVMGKPLLETEKYLLYRLPSQAWPVMLRINLNTEGSVASFFIYRSDF